ncbi:hypothetical protein Tco_0609159 [Tanacetum coccineum]
MLGSFLGLYILNGEQRSSIDESKDLSSLALDELIGNLKVHEVVMEKDFEIYRGKKERIKSIALKAKKESSDDETLTSGSDDEEYVMVYIKEMLKKFRLEDYKPTKTPMSTKIKLTKDDEANSVDSSKYRENPKTTHLEAVKRIFRFAKKQMALAISTTEAEYVSAELACQQGNISIDKVASEDNIADIYLTKALSSCEVLNYLMIRIRIDGTYHGSDSLPSQN